MRIASLCLCMMLAAVSLMSATAADPTIDPVQKWAWSPGASWINCRPTETNGAVIGRFVCSNYLYSSTVGWIHLGDGTPTNGYHYSNADEDDYGVNVDEEGHLTGYAWCESTGWINFEWTNKEYATAPKIDLETGNFSGLAWGDTLGWISLTNAWVYVKTDKLAPGPDGNGNNIPDDWEMANVGNTTTLAGGGGTNDWDKDGMSDYEEYVAGTSPTNSADCLALTSISVTNGTNVTISWSSKDTRFYDVDTRTNLLNGSWTNYTRMSVTGTPTVLTLPAAGETQVFYRVQAVLPLSD